MHWLMFMLLAVFLSGSPAWAGQAQPSEGKGFEQRKVLFSGHSLLDNPLPDWVEMIARSKSKTLIWEEQIVIGSPVRVRSWGDGGWAGYRDGKNKRGEDLDIATELKHSRDATPYDALVLAEAHNLLSMVLWENAIGYLRHFHERLLDGNRNGKTFYYHSWLDIDKRDPAPWMAHEENAAVTWQCVAEKARLTLEADGRSSNIVLLPAGSALVELVRRSLDGRIAGIQGRPEERMNQIFADNVHLTEAGIYYLAAVTYASLFGQSPEGAAVPPSVPAALARDLQSTAWSAVGKARQQAEGSRPSMEMCRRVLAEKTCPSYWSMKGEPGQVNQCRSFFSQTNPGSGNAFLWPDPDWVALPDP